MTDWRKEKEKLNLMLTQDFMSYSEIGKVYGVSRERIRVVCGEFGLRKPVGSTTSRRWKRILSIDPMLSSPEYVRNLRNSAYKIGKTSGAGNLSEITGLAISDARWVLKELGISSKPSPEEQITILTVPGDSSDCWSWTGMHFRNGYARVYHKNGEQHVHRILWRLRHKREIPEGAQVCHSCDNRNCVNPQHLYLGSALTNAMDREQRHPNSLTQKKCGRRQKCPVRLRKGNQSIDYPSQSAAAKSLGVRQCSISSVLRGDFQSLKGWTVERLQ